MLVLIESLIHSIPFELFEFMSFVAPSVSPCQELVNIDYLLEYESTIVFLVY